MPNLFALIRILSPKLNAHTNNHAGEANQKTPTNITQAVPLLRIRNAELQPITMDQFSCRRRQSSGLHHTTNLSLMITDPPVRYRVYSQEGYIGWNLYNGLTLKRSVQTSFTGFREIHETHTPFFKLTADARRQWLFQPKLFCTGLLWWCLPTWGNQLDPDTYQHV